MLAPPCPSALRGEAIRHAEPPLSAPLRLALAVVAIAAIFLPGLLIARAGISPPAAAPGAALAAPRQVAPGPSPVPEVAPVIFTELEPEDARAYNRRIPFSTAPNPAARPFHIFGAAEDRTRARDCLAAAIWYEAGDDPAGQRAVAQVVLNRVRHPAFPKSVCGVVFQGSERTTGCQFTFTCDGAMARIPSAPAWERARRLAGQALDGAVEARVGQATHYHTDWVVPYWSASLEKITEVHSHLFFRWAGWWGTRAAFNRRYAGSEPLVPALAPLSTAHRASEQDLLTLDGVADLPAGTGPLRESRSEPGTFLVALDSSLGPDEWPALAARACGERPRCKVLAWKESRAVPSDAPPDIAQLRSMTFSYLRDRDRGLARMLWNCDQAPRNEPDQCMRRQLAVTVPPLRPAGDTTDPSERSADRPAVGDRLRFRALPQTTGARQEPPRLEGVRRSAD